METNDLPITYPSIVCKVNGRLFSVSSEYVTTIMQMPTCELIPDAPSYVLGLVPCRDNFYTMFDLRSVFGERTLHEEGKAFNAMLDARKADHVNWVKELERSIAEEEPFRLATDPHQCAFGKWYDHYEPENSEIAFHLKKIEEPHRLIHEAAINAVQCDRNHAACAREQCLKKVFKSLKGDYVPRVLSLLDDAKKIFEDTVYREMALLLNDGRHLGFTVDDVVSVEDLRDTEHQEAFQGFQHGKSFRFRVKKSEKTAGTILELDVPELLNSIGFGEAESAVV